MFPQENFLEILCSEMASEGFVGPKSGSGLGTRLPKNIAWSFRFSVGMVTEF